ncbi:hypothetical protein [Streptomyces sp. NPDC048256]|uniref:hypothetical protein n=1 Tax=Streptomyces sp. NPDC048256 TaxID=3154613 RepID=UPI0033DD963D
MQPLDYRDHLLDVLKNSPDVQRVQVPEGTPYPYPLAVTVAGRDQLWQIMGQSADGAQKGKPTAPVHGDPAAWTTAPVTAAPDAWLGGVVGATEATDTRKIDVWTARGKQNPGLTVFFHNGEKAFVRLA